MKAVPPESQDYDGPRTWRCVVCGDVVARGVERPWCWRHSPQAKRIRAHIEEHPEDNGKRPKGKKHRDRRKKA